MKFKVCGVDCVSEKQSLTAGEVLMIAYGNEALVWKPTNGESHRWYKLALDQRVYEWDDIVNLQEGERYHILMFGRCEAV